MTSKLSSLFTLLILLGSCSSNTGKEKETSVATRMDSISEVDIMYLPAFTHRSVLHIDKKTGTSTFTVDTTENFGHEVPRHKLMAPLGEFETQTSVGRFWDEGFLHSLARDTTKLGARDGMHVWVFYTDGKSKDSVNVGNDYPPNVRSIILEQLNFLNGKAKDTAMKVYLKELKEYL
ncbi:MAG: hypothetical protein EOO46_22045 [Flavobacterium sp.]|nr:MAG: hypothetical protein EOO46_22045 [Flavobacterium sp.]